MILTALPLLLAVLSFAVAAVLGIISFFLNKKNRDDLLSVATLFFLLEIFLVIVALATDDPLFEQIPPVVQIIMLGAAGITGFWGGVYKLILAPIYNRLTHLEVGQGKIQIDVTNIKSDVHLIKERLISGKRR